MRQVYLIIGLVTAILISLPFNSAYAQFGGFNYGSGFAAPLYIGREWGLGTQSQNSNRIKQKLTESLNTKNSNTSIASSKLLVYKVSNTVRRRNLAQFVAKTREIDPDGAAKMEALFASTDVMSIIDKRLMDFGLRSNNVADAYAVYWTNAWLGSQGRTDNLTSMQLISVRNQAAKALLATLPFTSATDAQKQELAEAMLIQAALIDAVVDDAQSDPALLAKVKVAIAQGAKGMGLDLDRMTLTTQGFRSI
jgi:hypothetical protein